MKKTLKILAFALCMSLLAGCAGTPVVYTDCTCPAYDDVAANGVPVAPVEEETPAAPTAEGALKTGLAITTGIGDSASATAEAEGKAEYDVTMVAVLVDDAGIIQDCIIDGYKTTVNFDTNGVIATDLATLPLTKNELGPDYHMKDWGKAIAEWDEQAAALAKFAVGKTVEELRSGAIDETGYAPDGTDLATSATIYLGGYVDAIEKAVANAKHLGAEAGHALKMAATAAIDGSKNATAEEVGLSELYVNVTALTMNGDVISSCYIDAVQGKVNFDTAGVITTDLTAPVQTKNELGPNYNMKTYGGAIAEWDEQAASFANYVTGKTIAEVKDIAVDETTKTTDADLLTSVTIKIGDFQSLIEKAAQ